MKSDNIISILRNNNLRITPQRKIIISILEANDDTLMTADMLLEACQLINPEINQTTIYRNLELFDSYDLLYKINVDRNTTAYKFVCSHHHHHHLICTKCSKMVALDYCPISTELKTLVQNQGYILTDHTLDLYGICKDCV